MTQPEAEELQEIRENSEGIHSCGFGEVGTHDFMRWVTLAAPYFLKHGVNLLACDIQSTKSIFREWMEGKHEDILPTNPEQTP